MKHLTVEQICVSNFPYYKYSLEYALDSLERMGGKNLEMYACDPHFHVDDSTLADAKALKKKIKNLRLLRNVSRLYALHGGYALEPSL